jgi:hypothetical protein
MEDNFHSIYNHRVGKRTRELMDKVYGVGLTDQLRFESEIPYIDIHHVFSSSKYPWLRDESRMIAFDRFLESQPISVRRRYSGHENFDESS